MTAALGALAGVLFVLLVVSRLAHATTRRQLSRAREEVSGARLEAASTAEQLAEANRARFASGAVGELARQLAAGNVPRETFSTADGEPMCTACRRRVARGQGPVQACGDCWWLDGGCEA